MSYSSKYSQEGYDVYELVYSDLIGSDNAIRQAVTAINETKKPFVVITYSLEPEVASTLLTSVQDSFSPGLKGMIHYSPLLEDGKKLFVLDNEGKYVP